MKYQAILIVHFDLPDEADLAERQTRLHEARAALESEFGETRLSIKARRPRSRPRATPPPRLDESFEIVRARHVG